MAVDAAGLPGRLADTGSLTRRASLTAVASLVDYAAKLGVGLLVTPVLVHSLGRALYGMWEMLLQLIGYMTAADGRPADALRLVIANRQGVDDAAARQRQIGAALTVWLLFLPLVATVGSVLVWLAPAITKAAPAQHGMVRLAAALLVLSFIVATLAAVPEAVLRGMNLGYKRMGWQAGLSVIGGLLLVGAVSAGLGLGGLGAAQVILFVLSGCCFWLLVRRYVPGFAARRPSGDEVRRMAGMSAWLALGDLISKALLASDVIVLGVILSPLVVSTYVLTGYAARTALGIFGFTIGAAMAGLGGLVGAEQYARAASLRRELLALTWVFAVSVGATVLVWNPAFVRLWVGAENYAGGWANVLIVCVMTQTMFIRCDAYLIDVALRPRQRVLVGAAAAVVTIGAAIPLTRAFGILGLCAATLAGRAVQSLAYPVIVASSLRSPTAVRVRALVRPFLATVAIYLAAASLGARVTVSGWSLWIVGAAASLPLITLVALAGLDTADRRAVLSRVRTAAGTLRG